MNTQNFLIFLAFEWPSFFDTHVNAHIFRSDTR